MLRKNSLNIERRIIDGTVYLSTGKFTYDTIHPDDKNYPLTDIGVNSKSTTTIQTPSQQELTSELDSLIIK